MDEGDPYRPFCSERCQLIDLDNWLSRRYRISTPVAALEEPESATTGISGMTGVPETEGDAKADGE